MLKLSESTFDWSKVEFPLAEAKHGEFMTEEEKDTKEELIKILKDDGHGHHHARYAERLKPFNVTIVPLDHRISTAAISFDAGIIYINRGFLLDPQTFYQLSVIMRHELCHNLMMHQIRMMKYLSDLPWSRISMSQSIHEVLNIIEDFEISNKKYTDEDKEVVRNTWINGEVISGLVTEDHREEWMDMSLEEMYNAFMKEMEATDFDGQMSGTYKIRSDGKSQLPANLETAAIGLARYKDIQIPSDFESVDEFIEALLDEIRWETPNFRFEDLPEDWKKVINGARKPLDDPNNLYNESAFLDMMQQIAKSKPMETVDLTSPVTGEVLCDLVIPEEKRVALEILKISCGHTSYKDDYQKWYDEILKTIMADPDLTDEDIKDLLGCVS